MEQLITPLAVTKWAKVELQTVQKSFVKNPSAHNWNACTRAMSVYQYVHWLFERGGVAEGYQLIDALTDNPVQSKWADLICQIGEVNEEDCIAP